MLAEPIHGEGGTGHFYGISLYLYSLALFLVSSVFFS